MPAINVARTDTFEIQRLKINEIGSQLFNVTSGGSDLSTGNLQLGDGTKSLPSLSFTNETSLGIYRPEQKTIAFVSSGKNIFDIKEDYIVSYKDGIIRKKSIPTSGGLTISPGSGYEYGTYTGVLLNGGSGTNGKATILVDYFSGTAGSGSGYQSGTFTSIPLIGGTGSGSTVDFSVSGLTGSLSNPGAGYTNGFYPNVALTYVSGSNNGSGATAIVEITGGSVGNVSISSNGNNLYEDGDVLTVSDSLLGSGGGIGFEYLVTADAGVLTFTNINKGPGYTTGDVLSLAQSVSITGINIPGTHVSNGCNLTSGSTTVTLGAATNEIIPGMILSLDQGGSIGGFPAGTVRVVSITNSTTVVVDTAANASGASNITFTSAFPTRITIPGGTSNLYPGFILSGSNYSGIDGAEIVSIIDANTIQVDTAGTTAFYQANLTFTPSWGDGGATQFTYTVGATGLVDTVTITDGGTGYADGDILTVNASDLINPIQYIASVESVQKITFTTTVSSSAISVGDLFEIDGGGEGGVNFEVAYVKSTGSNIDYILLTGSGFTAGNDIREVGTTTPVYTINTADTKNKYYIDTGGGSLLHPDLTFYIGETYRFALTGSTTGHPFRFSEFPDGSWNVVGPFTTTVSTLSDIVNITSTAGISVGMYVEETGNDPGGLADGTTVLEVIDSTSIRLSANPISSGSIVIEFGGTEYSTGVTISSSYVDIKITEDTPSPLYYYCTNHPDMAGEDGEEASITKNTNNPRVFGSGFSATINSAVVTDVITLDVESGNIQCDSISAPQADFSNTSVSQRLTCLDILGAAIQATSLTSTTTLQLSASTTITLAANLNLGDNATLTRTSGDFLTNGEIKTTSAFTSNEHLTITNAEIETINNFDLILRPDGGRVALVDSTTAFVIPVGDTNDRPIGLAQDGAIRFNTETNQYEGYSSTSSSWSSLGGVRDLDGNTYILAEENVGTNDNTLWFINDNSNTQRFTPSWHEYVNVKQIRSPNVTAPDYDTWTSSTPVTLGQYLKWRNNIYEVTLAGVTATSGNEPIHTSGALVNGSAELTWYVSAVDALTYEEISEVRISPLGYTPLVVNSDLRLFKNVISTDINNLVLRPNGGKRVDIDAATTLTVPVGSDGERGTPSRGGIRFNTTSLQFEGYDGSNWGSLGGVKDVDQNTYIIPETSPGANENILYFYNDGDNTLQLTTLALDFFNIDTIRSVTSNEFEITANLITFNAAETTIDNTQVDTTFLHTSKQYFDIGLSSGLYVEPVLRLDNTGNFYFNTTFGTGSFTGVKIFDNQLKVFEIADLKTITEKISLVKGTVDNGSSILYDTAIEVGSKTSVIAENPTTGEKEFIEFGVIDNGSDVYHTEYGNVRTGDQLIIPTFEITPQNEVRINVAIGANVSPTETVNITFVSQITKK